MSNWISIELGQIASIFNGSTPSTNNEDYWNGDIIWITPKDLSDQNKKYILKGERTITQKALSNTKLLPEGTVLLSSRAPIGLLSIASTKLVTNQGFKNIVVNADILHNEFLYYYLKLKKNELNNLGSGTTFKELSKSTLEKYKIKLPDLPTQKSIAKVLSDLDIKIELNNRINRELEGMAKTLYDYWFVQFDFPCLPSDYRPSGQVNPNSDLAQKIIAFSTYTKVGGLPLPDGKKWFVYVILCEDGSFYKGMTNDLYRRFYEHYTGHGADWTKTHKPKKIIHWEQLNTQDEARSREDELKTGFGRTWLQREYEKFIKYGYKAIDGLPAHQTRLMPAGKMVYNAELKREIPEGWTVKKIGKVLSTKLGGTPSTEIKEYWINGEYHWLNSGEIANFPIITSELKITKKAIENSSTYLLPKGTIAISITRHIRPSILAIDSCANQSVIGILESEELKSSYLYPLIKNEIPRYLSLRTGAQQPHINKQTIDKTNIIIPANEILKKYYQVSNQFYEKIINNAFQNQQLAELRDWLLPMLMNGQVTSTSSVSEVKEAEERLSVAAEPEGEYNKNRKR